MAAVLTPGPAEFTMVSCPSYHLITSNSSCTSVKMVYIAMEVNINKKRRARGSGSFGSEQRRLKAAGKPYLTRKLKQIQTVSKSSHSHYKITIT